MKTRNWTGLTLSGIILIYIVIFTPGVSGRTSVVSLHPRLSDSANGPKSADQADVKPITVGILLFDNVEIIDYAGPWEVFGEAGFKVFTISETSEPITTVFGQKVIADYNFANSPKADFLLVPGGGVGKALDDPLLIKWIQINAENSQYVLSVCTGAFLLAKAGLLDGLTATTVSSGIPELTAFAPKTKVVSDQRYVDNGHIITTAGLSSGIDGAFHLVEKVLGRGEAEKIALGMEYRWDPDSKFARAALADRYLPDIPDIKGIKATMLSTQGGVDNWESRTLVAEPSSAIEILKLLNSRISANTTHIQGPVVFSQGSVRRPDGKAEIRWRFSDDKGGSWRGNCVVEPSLDEKDKFVVTLKLARRI
jgi:putative intracellular protease/amidase